MKYEVIEIASGARMSHQAGKKGDIMGTTLFDSVLDAQSWMRNAGLGAAAGASGNDKATHRIEVAR